MTSEVSTSQGLEAPQTFPPEQETCACCMHFAVDFDSMPELFGAKRPSRQPKKRQLEVAATIR